MTPLRFDSPATPPGMLPQPKPQPRGEPARVPCPNTGEAVYVSPCFDHNSQMYCESCKQVHRVLREAEGVRLA